MKDERFPKARLFQIQWRGLLLKIQGKRNWKPLFHGGANFAGVCILFWLITWRRPWQPCAAYSQGWDACWRQMYSENQALKAKIEELQQQTSFAAN